jgi:putrescine aminotransferase
LYKRYAYHGVTLGTLSANGIASYRRGFGPYLDGFEQVASSYCYRCDLGKTYPGCRLACADDLESVLLAEGPETVAAFIAEPIAGVGGHILSPPGYLEKIRNICDQYDVLFVADEVVTGFGRTGAWFGVNHENVVPDIMTFAKGLSSGYLPLGATVIQERIWEGLRDAPDNFIFTHGYTYSGHATCCAVGLRNIQIIEREGLVEKAKRDGEYLLSKLSPLADLPIVGEVRGLGLLAAVDLTANRATHEKFDPAMGVGKKVSDRMLELGVITRAGLDIVQFRPPLTITRPELDEIVDVTEVAIREVAASV